MSTTLALNPDAAEIATSVTVQPKPKTHVPVIDHALKAGALQRNATTRALANLAATAQAFAQGLTAEDMEELLHMSQAACQRLFALQKGWAQSWTEWFRYADQVKGANTMSKLVEREMNTLAQMGQILGNQMTDLVGLQENVEVDYFYWVNKKIKKV